MTDTIGSDLMVYFFSDASGERNFTKARHSTVSHRVQSVRESAQNVKKIHI